MQGRGLARRLAVPGYLFAAVLLTACATAPREPQAQGNRPAPCEGTRELVVHNNTGTLVDVYGRGMIGTVNPGTTVLPLGPREGSHFYFRISKETGGESYRAGGFMRNVTYEVRCVK